MAKIWGALQAGLRAARLAVVTSSEHAFRTPPAYPVGELNAKPWRQPHEARTDFAAIESELEVISEAACAAADAPGARGNRAWQCDHHVPPQVSQTRSNVFCDVPHIVTLVRCVL